MTRCEICHRPIKELNKTKGILNARILNITKVR